MIERKTYKADIDRHRPKIFLLSLLFTVALFFIALSWKSYDITAELMKHLDDDISIDMDMLPEMKAEKNIIAAEVHKKPESSEQINKVDEVVEKDKIEDLKEQIKFKTSEADDADKLQEREVEPIAPPNADNNDAPLRIVEELPEFPGGMTEYVKWLSAALKYPHHARQAKQQGMVAATFVVEKDGSITDIKLIKQTNTSLDAEVLRVLRIMPKWKPGKNHGKPCRCVIGLPVVFAM